MSAHEVLVLFFILAVLGGIAYAVFMFTGRVEPPEIPLTPIAATEVVAEAIRIAREAADGH